MPITLYYFPSPNGRKVSIALEEMGLEYHLQLVNIFAGEAKASSYLAICPNARIPALIDRLGDNEEVTLFESGAILQYLGRKTGQLYPNDSSSRARVDSWLFWQMASLGPMTGQVTWFKRAARKVGREPCETSLAIHRFIKEMKRLYEILDGQLASGSYLCGDYSIADIACWPWIDQYGEYVGGTENYPNIHCWRQRIAVRPAVKRAMTLGLKETQKLIPGETLAHFSRK